MDLHAALERIDPLEIDAVDPIDGDGRRRPGRPPATLHDVRLRYGTVPLRLIVRVEEAPDSRGLTDRARELKRRSPRGAFPVLAAPYIGPALRRRLEREGIGWFDSLGNIHVHSDRPRMLLHVEARGTRASLPRFRGRLFSPAHSRVARALLEHPDGLHRLKELALTADTDASSVSRAMKVFTEAKLIEREPGGWRVPDPRALLDAWLDRALAEPKEILARAFHTPEAPDSLSARMVETAGAEGIRIAFTGARAGEITLGEPGPAAQLVEAYVDPFSRVGRLVEMLGQLVETRTDNNLRLTSNPQGGAFVGVSVVAGIPVVGRMQLITDLYREGTASEGIAQALRDRWSI